MSDNAQPSNHTAERRGATTPPVHDARNRQMSARRLARTVALSVIIGIGIVNLYWAVSAWNLSDGAAYWNAALRVREGGQLYVVVANPDASEVYRYAPWFAWLTVPFTFLPVKLVGALWSAVLLGATAMALVPLVRARAWLAVAFFAPILIGISAGGNVHALMVAALVWGVDRRSGPVAIGLAASLKIFPILFAAVYLGRREWTRAAIAVLVAAALWAPALLYDLRTYPTDAGQAGFLFVMPVLWAAVVAVGMAMTIRLARSRFGWLAAAMTVTVSLPRLFVYDVTYLMVGAGQTRRPPVT